MPTERKEILEFMLANAKCDIVIAEKEIEKLYKKIEKKKKMIENYKKLLTINN